MKESFKYQTAPSPIILSVSFPLRSLLSLLSVLSVLSGIFESLVYQLAFWSSPRRLSPRAHTSHSSFFSLLVTYFHSIMFPITLAAFILITTASAASSTVSSTLKTTTSTPTTTIPPTITPFPLTSESHYLKADTCVQSCARAASNLWVSRLSCSGTNPATCICQTYGMVAASAHACASISCPAITAPATNDGEAVAAKLAIYGFCSSNGLTTNSSTTILPSLVSADPVTTAPIITTTSTNTVSALPSTMTTPSSGDRISQTNSSPTSIATQPTSSQTPNTKPSLGTGAIAGFICGGVALVALIIGAIICIGKRNKRKTSEEGSNSTKKQQAVEKRGEFKRLSDGGSESFPLENINSTPGSRGRKVSKANFVERDVESTGNWSARGPPSITTLVDSTNKSVGVSTPTTLSGRGFHRHRQNYMLKVKVWKPSCSMDTIDTNMLVDTGCMGANFVSPVIVKYLDADLILLDDEIDVEGLKGNTQYTVKYKVDLVFRGVDGSLDCPTSFYVMEEHDPEFGILLGDPDCTRFGVLPVASFPPLPPRRVLTLHIRKSKKRSESEERRRQEDKKRREAEHEEKIRRRENNGGKRDPGGSNGGSSRHDTSGASAQ